MSSNQLTFPAEVLALPKAVVSFTPRGLAFADDATDAQVLAIGHRLVAARGYLNWAFGSLFAEMVRRRPPKPDSLAENDMGWVSEFCDAHHLDPKLRRELLGVFMFYRNAPDNLPGLSFEHYREAFFGVWGLPPEVRLEKALGYLAHAHAEGMTVTQLRAYIRASGRTTKPEPQADLNLAAYSAVFDFMRFARHELGAVASYTPERARLILDDLGAETLAYIDALRRLAAASPASPAASEAVESHAIARGKAVA